MQSRQPRFALLGHSGYREMGLVQIVTARAGRFFGSGTALSQRAKSSRRTCIYSQATMAAVLAARRNAIQSSGSTVMSGFCAVLPVLIDRLPADVPGIGKLSPELHVTSSLADAQHRQRAGLCCTASFAGNIRPMLLYSRASL